MSNVTLYSFCKGIPVFGGRVFMDAAPQGAVFPYAIVWDAQGGVTNAFYGTSGVYAVYPCVTVYDQTVSNETSGTTRLRILNLLDAVRGAKDAVNTHSDGVTPYLVGGVQSVFESVPILDQNAAGRYYATARLSALLYRR